MHHTPAAHANPAAQPVQVTIPGGGTFDSDISKAEIQAMREEAWPGSPYIISTKGEASIAISDIMHRCSTEKQCIKNGSAGSNSLACGVHHRSGLSASQAALVLGFDVESRPSSKAGSPGLPPALVQVATPWAVYLFRISPFMERGKFTRPREAVADALLV